MTKLNDKARSLLASIAAQDDWRPTTTLTTPMAIDITASANPLYGYADKSEQPPKAKPQKATKKKSEKKFKEPNISRLVAKDGTVSFRVQIRRTVEGEKHSLAKTFRHLSNEKNGVTRKSWRSK